MSASWIAFALAFAYCSWRAWMTYQPWHDGEIIKRYNPVEYAEDKWRIVGWLLGAVGSFVMMFLMWEVGR